MWALAKAWLAVGIQSPGGGVSTLFVIRRIVVERHSWVSARIFAEDWAFSQLSPGIHLVAFAGLLGRRIAGWRGVVVSVAGMMLPAGVITAVMTAAYASIGDHPLARAAVVGMAPVTGGMTIALALVMARDARRSGWHVAVDGFAVLAAFAILFFTQLSSVLVLVVFALAGTRLLRGARPASRDDPAG